MLGYFEARVIAGVEHVSDGVYRRTVVIDGDPGVLELSLGGPDHLLLLAHLPHWEGLIHVVRRARRIFNLDQDARARPSARPGHRAAGARPAGDPSARDVGSVRDRCSSHHRSRHRVGAANTIATRIIGRFGVPVRGLRPLGLTHVFPEPSTWPAPIWRARLDRSSGRGRVRVRPGRGGLDPGVGPRRSVGRARRGDHGDPRSRPWSAHYLALRMGEPDAFPASDLGLRRALSRDRSWRRARSSASPSVGDRGEHSPLPSCGLHSREPFDVLPRDELSARVRGTR